MKNLKKWQGTLLISMLAITLILCLSLFSSSPALSLKNAFKINENAQTIPFLEKGMYLIVGAFQIPENAIQYATSIKIKGTEEIRQCIETIKDKGYKINYREISGVLPSDVIAAISGADLIIDQLYSDIHAATFATESIKLGKPVLVFGYGKDVLDTFEIGRAHV